VRELREFRAHHETLTRHGLCVAGISRESPESNRRWSERLKLPYPLLSDPVGAAANEFGVIRRIGVGPWSLEFFRRSTFLVNFSGEVAAVWGDVRVRGHALEILEVAEALERPAADPTLTFRPRSSGTSG